MYDVTANFPCPLKPTRSNVQVQNGFVSQPKKMELGKYTASIVSSKLVCSWEETIVGCSRSLMAKTILRSDSSKGGQAFAFLAHPESMHKNFQGP